MKVRTKILKGWCNTTSFLFSQNLKSSCKVQQSLNDFLEQEINGKGYKELNIAFDTLRNKNATEKIIVKGWYWRGSWASPTKEIITVYYK